VKKQNDKNLSGRIILIALAVVLALSGQAMGFGHYTPGVEAIDAATLPPPGFYYVMYNLFYSADNLKDDQGNDIDAGFDVNVYANAHRFCYVTDLKILGADYGFDAIVPLVNTDIEIRSAGTDESTFGLGDVTIEPLILNWHTPHWDAGIVFSLIIPTGESDEPSSPGAGYWSFMGGLGATYYFDDARTWTLSLLTRWLKNTEDDDTEITPGADMVAEYGLGKKIPIGETFQLTAGIAGYSYAQLTDDSGTGADDEKFSGHAIGPEVRLMAFKPFPMELRLRYQFEYGVENASQGNNACLVFVGCF